jgi:hypothetical protein
MSIRLLPQLFLGAMSLLALNEVAAAQEQPAAASPVVVELFQSQGCSSCPPAEANLNAIAGQPGILALSFAVTYWDQLGWKDTFATQAYTDRQWAFAHHHQRDSVWTPQVYVNGDVDLVGTDRTQLDHAIARATAAAEKGPSLRWQPGKLVVGAGPAHQPCDVWLVRYDPRTLNVAIGAGENGGRTLPHRNVVRELVNLGRWDGSSHTYLVPAPTRAGLATAALVQVAAGGPIIEAATSPLD